MEGTLEMLSFSDVVRSYDVTPHLSVATTIDRVTQLLMNAKPESGVYGYINCEDEMYLGAALGCTLGIMRSPMWQDKKGVDYDPRKVRARSGEVIRAVKWQRLAPAFGVGQDKVVMSNEILTDSWLFNKGEVWLEQLVGKEIKQGAPAVVARGMDLPVVSAGDGNVPFVVASKNPNGAVSVAALPRTSTGKGIFLPLADVSVNIGQGYGPIGIFGEYRYLTLNLPEPFESKRILAQDLAGNEAVDITGRVLADGSKIILSGSLIKEIGLSAASPDDLSDPGMVIVIK